MFKLLNLTMRFIMLLTFVIASPFLFIVCISVSNSFKEAFNLALEIITLPVHMDKLN